MANTAITGEAISGAASSGDMQASVYDPNFDGKIGIGQGGTDASTAAGARTNLGLGTAATKDVPTSGNAASGQVVKGNDTRLTNARTPTSHTHDASAIVSGTIDPDRLGTGSGGTGAKFLNDNQEWAAPSSAPPVIYAGGNTGTAFDFDPDNGTDQRFYLSADATMSAVGTPVDGRVYELSFEGGGQDLTLPANFVVIDEDAHPGVGTTITVSSGYQLTILAQYVATSNGGDALTGAGGPYFRCTTMSHQFAPL
jgi:hypothetical protein